MQVEHEFVVAAPIDTVRVLLTDPDRSTACIPGLTVETFAPGEYGGRLRLRVGSTTVTYRGTATVSPGDTVRLDLDGQEVRGSGIAKGTLTMSLSGEGESTRVGIEADISVTGRLGSLDPAVLEDALRRMHRCGRDDQRNRDGARDGARGRSRHRGARDTQPGHHRPGILANRRG